MQKHTQEYLLFLICFLFVSLNSQAKKDNRILNFHSDIRIDENGQTYITETFKILVANRYMTQNIVRKIPNYRFTDGYTNVKIHIDSVLKNDTIKKYSLKNENVNYVINIDDDDIWPGVYEYTLKYSSNDLIDYDHKYGKLVWNVNGNEWDIEIDTISATVHFPHGTKLIANECDMSTVNNKCSYTNIGDTIVEFYSNSKLSIFSNFTITTTFESKVIKRTPFLNLFRFNIETIFLTVIITLLCLFFIYWWLINTMHEKAIVRPTSYPPLGKSPTTIRYIFKRDSDIKGLMVCLVSMAVKKTILIKKTGNLSYTLTSQGNKKELSEDELIVYNNLFTGAAQDIVIGVGGKKSVLKTHFWNWEKALRRKIKNTFYLVLRISSGLYASA